MTKVSGRILDAPKVLYRDNQTPETTSGGWNLRKSPKFQETPQFQKPPKFEVAIPKAMGGTLGNWAFLRLYDFSGADHRPALSAFMDNIATYGMRSATPISETLNYDEMREDFFGPKGSLKQTIVALGSKRLDILLITLPAKDTALYNRIKWYSDQNAGIHTVCVIEEMFLKRQGSYFGNVALKFNLKLGGINHTLRDIDLGIVSQGKTMIVGIDVVHPSPGSGRASIAAMAGSIDKNLAQWPVDLRVQIREGKEMLDKIRDMINSRLALWMNRYDQYPENILIYRDGVSEGQYEQVLKEELDEMKEETQQLYKKARQSLPRFTLIIVAKRHHTRFFPKVEDQNAPFIDRGNFERGLVVDRGITEARTWDFFLQSHNALQGTARPAHYVVLWDEIFTNTALQLMHRERDMSATDRLQKLTNSLCYLFSRATKAVKIPAPVYYADIACDRASRYLAGVDTTDGESVLTEGQRVARCNEYQGLIKVHDNLKDSMFYV